MSDPAAPPAVPIERAVLEAMPGAVFVIDELGTIVVATEQAGRLVDRTRDELLGTSVLEYVDPDATWAYASAMDFAMSDVYGDAFSGPVRVSLLTATKRVVAADLWTANRLHDPQIAGLVCLLGPQTAALGIAEAVAAAGGGAPLAEVAAAVAGALAGYPVIADSAVVTWVDDQVEVLATHGVPAALVDGTAGDEPWASARASGSRVIANGPDAFPAALRDLAQAAGYASVWAEPSRLGDGDTTDVVIVFRRFPVDPTPNELSYVHQAAATLALARLRPGAA